MKLTVERVFRDPPLVPVMPSNLKFAPDASYVAFLQVADDDGQRLDLWKYDLASGNAHCWVDARTLEGGGGAISSAEKAERERRRQFAGGITDFQIGSDGRHVLMANDGAGYLYQVADGSLHRFTPAGSRHTDLQLAPQGRRASFVRDDDLYMYDIGSGGETAVTRDGGHGISSGRADFIAQEEMHRFDGHWWSPDESYLAYTRVDESPVAVTPRIEFEADRLNVVEQRYPYAGGTNAVVTLWLWSAATGRTQRVAYDAPAGHYLARVGWAGSTLMIQHQGRDQKSLQLQFFDPATGAFTTALSEVSDFWVNLHDNFRHLGPDRFLWTSDRDGSDHLYLYDSGNSVRQLTTGHGRVNKVVYADNDQVLFSGWFGNPLEQHLYRVSTSGASAVRDPQQLTEEPGWHDVTVAADGHRIIDRYSALDIPGEIRVANLATGERLSMVSQAVDARHPYYPHLAEHVTPELGHLQADDGQRLYYRLYRPAVARAAEQVPLIIHVYGGPGAQRVRNEWPPLLLQLFCHHGFGVLELDNRGSANRERQFQTALYRRLGEVEVADQTRGARFAASLNWVDDARLGVFGHSYGGYMSIMCLAKRPELFKAGVAVAPVSDWRLYDTHYTERYLGNPDDEPSAYEESSVFAHLDGFRRKLLLIHGMADDNVLYTHSTKLYRALQQRDVAFEMMAYPGAKHALQERDVAIHRFKLILDFFRRSL